MSLILYRPTYDASPPTWRVQLTLAEKGLSWEEIPVAYDKKPAEFLAKNPRGQVPTLVHGDVAVYETNAILEYIDLAFPDPPLMPANPGARAACLVRINEASNYVMAAFMAVWRHRMSKGDEARGKELVGEIKAELTRWEGYLERAGGSFLCGDAFSLADISLYPYIAGAMRGGLPMDDLPRLRAFYEATSARPSVVKTTPAAWKEAPGERIFA